MVVKIYISGISGNKEVKKRQQRVLMILDSKNIKYEIIDITEPGREADKDFMQNNSKSNGGTVSDPNPRSPLPPQVFNDEEYCGDYDQFDLANEVDTLEVFLKVEAPPEELVDDKATVNGDVIANAETESKENSHELKENSTEEPPETNETTVDNGSTDAVAKEGSAEKDLIEESTTVRQKSVERDQQVDNTEESTEENKEVSEKINKESSPAELEAVNENGAISSREQSEEKEEPDQKKEAPSEALIQSEQAAATD